MNDKLPLIFLTIICITIVIIIVLALYFDNKTKVRICDTIDIIVKSQLNDIDKHKLLEQLKLKK